METVRANSLRNFGRHGASSASKMAFLVSKSRPNRKGARLLSTNGELGSVGTEGEGEEGILTVAFTDTT